MGLSNMLPGGEQGGGAAAAPTGDAAAVNKPDFGDKLGSYFQSKYPVAGGLADMVFGNNHQPAAGQPAAVAPASAPIAAMPAQAQPDYSQMISQNAQPKQSGLGADILKMFFG